MSHEVKIVTVSNGGGKAKRATCSCGFLGVRFHAAPKDVKVAIGKAQLDGERHITEV